MIGKIKNLYETKRAIFLTTIISAWLVFTILIGIFIGLRSKSKVVHLSPEEENSRAVASMKEDEEKIIKGEMLSTKNNLDMEQIEYSKNYVKNKQNN
ncbi:hypothetical protein EZH24_08590 [Brachyspira catarrhinii]|uniref:Uncharacterized protein n=1 Tax=Brachyspira catarrhinii TaxID=2528966 RepID=A0ABY2TPK0_9SPIR|nr:hypothetical protein EZH24_08590 [Brachyspira catarrhinii]